MMPSAQQRLSALRLLWYLLAVMGLRLSGLLLLRMLLSLFLEPWLRHLQWRLLLLRLLTLPPHTLWLLLLIRMLTASTERGRALLHRKQRLPCICQLFSHLAYLLA